MNKRIFILILFLASLAFVWFDARPSRAQSVPPDAIAIRVMPNRDHLSAKRWYEMQGFDGSPQSIVVDGYQGVRDGRTVYVNVGNAAGGLLYTNIYLISYSQDAEPATKDIFGQMLKNWHFNTNVTGIGHCRQDGRACLADRDCGMADHCDSLKARITRDTLRLSHLGDIESYVNVYRQEKGTYPLLAAGTYLKHRSSSVWPSWNNQFSQELGVNLPLDPVNRLGDCPGFDLITCWNVESQSYGFGWGDFPGMPDPADNSLAYFYASNSAGAEMRVCGALESGLTVWGAPVCTFNVCIDNDNDGYGVFSASFCPRAGADCNDTDDSVHAASGPEICGNNLDDDCNGSIDCADAACSADPACQAMACLANGCGGGCPAGCTPALDPDCGCTPGDGCCAMGCTLAGGDTDCPPACVSNGCGGGCAPGCSYPADPDCGGCRIAGDGCCPAGCSVINDPDCVPTCVDLDNDGYNAAGPLCPAGNDCNDSNALVHPGATELCDAIDHDCDGNQANGFSAANCQLVCAASGHIWTANGGALDCCGDNALEAGPYQARENTPSNLCADGRDNDCDGYPDALDSDCGGGCSNTSEDNYQGSVHLDCDQCDERGDQDGNQSNIPNEWQTRYPSDLLAADRCDRACNSALAAPFVHADDFELGNETSCDNIDNDCDGQIDENISSTFYAGPAGTDGVGICHGGIRACAAGAMQVTLPEQLPEAEICGNGIDEDCDGADEACPPACTDADGDGVAVEGGVCGPVDCNDALPQGAYMYPGNPNLTCDGLDNDCSGTADADEGCDDDHDGYCDAGMQIYNSTAMCVNTVFAGAGMWGNDCNDNDPGINPAATIACGQGVCANTVPACIGAVQQTCVPGPPGIESNLAGTCADGLDNDCDNLTDFPADPDCAPLYCTFNATLPCTLAP